MTSQVLLWISTLLFAAGAVVAFAEKNVVFGFALAGAAVYVAVQALAATP